MLLSCLVICFGSRSNTLHFSLLKISFSCILKYLWMQWYDVWDVLQSNTGKMGRGYKWRSPHVLIMLKPTNRHTEVPCTILFCVCLSFSLIESYRNLILIDSAHCFWLARFMFSFCEALLSPLHEVHKDRFLPHFTNKPLWSCEVTYPKANICLAADLGLELPCYIDYWISTFYCLIEWACKFPLRGVEIWSSSLGPLILETVVFVWLQVQQSDIASAHAIPAVRVNANTSFKAQLNPPTPSHTHILCTVPTIILSFALVLNLVQTFFILCATVNYKCMYVHVYVSFSLVNQNHELFFLKFRGLLCNGNILYVIIQQVKHAWSHC